MLVGNAQKNVKCLLSIYVVIHSCYMPEEGETPGLDAKGENV